MAVYWQFIDEYTCVLQDTEKCESPCYELHKIALSVTNPFKEGSEFRIVLVEAKGDVFQEKKNTALLEAPKRKNKKITSKIDAGKKLRPETPETPPAKPKYVDTAEDTEADCKIPLHVPFYC